MLCARPPRTRAVLVSAFFIAAATCGAFVSVPQTTRAALAYTVQPYELQVVQLVNAERALRGAGPLTPEARLWQSAETHTMWMASVGILSHTGSGGSTLATRVVAAGYANWTALGEVIAAGYPTPQDVVRGWKGSSSHWTILMNPIYRDIGAALVFDSGGAAWWGVDVGNNLGPGQPLVTGSVMAPTATPSRTPPPASVAPPSATLTPKPSPSPTPPASATPQAVATARPTLAPVSILAGHAYLQGRTIHTTVSLYLDGLAQSAVGPDGSFVVLGVGAGSHVLEARAPGWLPSRKAVLVPPNQFLMVGDTRLLAGDIMPDLHITPLDPELIRAGVGRCLGTISYQRHLDLDLSGCIDDADVRLSANNVGRSGPTEWTLTP